MNTHTREFQENLTPERAFDVLINGNNRFVNNLKINRNLLQQLNETRDGQFPFAVVLSCMDSRTSVELIFDQGLGDIFSIRIAGNIVNQDIVGSMEYACKVVGSKLIVVLGHSRCGAIQGALQNVEFGHLTGLLHKIKPASAKFNGHEKYALLSDAERLAHANVLHSIESILDMSDIIRSHFEEGKIGIVGGMYSVETGHVEFIHTMFAGKKQEVGLEEIANS